eukprot:scaffold870_cov268-Pinguiococcus_pyrenoidosus.AAC.18
MIACEREENDRDRDADRETDRAGPRQRTRGFVSLHRLRGRAVVLFVFRDFRDVRHLAAAVLVVHAPA